MDDELLGPRRDTSGNGWASLVRQVPRGNFAFPAAKSTEGGRGGAQLNDQTSNVSPTVPEPEQNVQNDIGTDA